MPVAVITHSPRRGLSSARPMATFFSGAPANLLTISSLQADTSKPQLLGCNGAQDTPLPASLSTQAPSEPRRDQLPPPRASSTASLWIVFSPSGLWISKPPSVLQPSQR